MEKLIELLNEFGEYDLVEHKGEICKWTTDDETGEINIYTDYTNNIISKKFGFIKWLVDNDKIDIDTYKTVYSGDLDKRKTLTMSSGGDEFYQVTEHGAYESLLMLLSISDTPIEDLISYLK